MIKALRNLHIVIPAGGVGTRLWPRSREVDPKQFILLSEGKSMTQRTFEYLEGFIPYERIYVISHDRYKQKLLGQIPKFLPENYISEPERRGTSAAIGLAAFFIKKRDPAGIVHFLVSDDYIEKVSRFRKMIKVAAETADEEKVFVVYGVEPAYPSTGYGYIQVERKVKEIEKIPVYKVKRFVEKPDEKTAQKFISSGDYFWHCSGFTARCDLLLDEMRSKWPQGFRYLNKIDRLSSLPADTEEGETAEIYRQIEKNAIEYTILEKTRRIMMATNEKTWRDIASWQVIYEISKKDKDGNVVISHGKEGEFIGLGAKNNLIHFDDQLVAAIGVEDLIIVDTGDAILICKKDKAQEVKELVNLLKKRGKTEYL